MEFGSNSKVKGKVLTGQSREILANILRFMRQEAECNKPVRNVKVKERVSIATGVSIRTIFRIENEMKKVQTGESLSFSTPNKKRITPCPKSGLDYCNEGGLRRTIINYTVTEKKVPSLRQIHQKFKNDYNYGGSMESLRKVMRKIGIRWSKTNRALLMEKPDIRHKRLTFLRSIKNFREEGRPIIYMDDTYIHYSDTHEKSGSDKSNEGSQRPVVKGHRLIILHAGGANGFVPNAYLAYNSQIKSGDYHGEMDFTNYEKWIKEKLIPNLPPRSVIVIDNAPYNNVEIQKAPDFGSPMEEMKMWLRARGIPFTDHMLKVELYSIIKMHKTRFKTYLIDKMLQDVGHEVLRLPPYHSDLNPIELVWASLKQFVADKNVDFNFKNVENHCKAFFDLFSEQDWISQCKHVKDIEDFYMEAEAPVDLIIDSIITNPNNDSEISDFSSGSDSDSDISEVEHF